MAKTVAKTKLFRYTRAKAHPQGRTWKGRAVGYCAPPSKKSARVKFINMDPRLGAIGERLEMPRKGMLCKERRSGRRARQAEARLERAAAAAAGPRRSGRARRAPSRLTA